MKHWTQPSTLCAQVAKGMTDQEINERLALAIGWPSTYTLHDGTVYVHEHQNDRFRFGSIWICGRVFDYLDPAVIWPIIVRYYCFPKMCGGEWMCLQQWGDTPEKAAALAVIRLSEKGLLK